MLPLALVCASQAATAWAASQPPIALWRLDCGRFGTSVPDSCYLIRHGDTFMLWDTGLNPRLAHRGEQKVGTHAVTLDETLPEQLARLGLVPRDIAIVALSHAHFDHVGGAVSFPRAVLLIGRKDYDALTGDPASLTSHPQDLIDGLAPWISGGSRKDLLDGNRDIFGDGSVIMLNTPGHTAGHHSLLVRLHHMGAIVLTGDLWDRAGEYDSIASPRNAADPAASAASIRYVKALVAETRATVIISHEVADVGKLPPFPKAAR